jgi:transitional endoplasmic reticulum ATPase
MMDGLKDRGQVVVIGATNRVDAIDPALRRPGRFDREIEIGVPSMADRVEIMQIHMRGMPISKDVQLKYLADRTHGFVGADISALAKEAAMKALRRYLPQIKLDEVVSHEVLDCMMVTADDFEAALKEVEPSAMREVLVEVPTVKWGDVGGLDDAKQEIIEAAQWPLSNPEKFEKMGIRPPKGILLYGPPGTGKTLLAKAVANESSANFISVRGPQLLSKWVGESERAIREVFKKARQVAPSIIFLDELDAIAPIRGSGMGNNTSERVVNQLLTELDGIEVLKNVVVIAATNRPEIVDSALIRSGRFDRLVFIGPPNRAGRIEIFKIHLKNIPVSPEVNVEELADLTENYVGADLESLCREAVMLALRENFDIEKVGMHHFRDSLKKVRPALVEDMIEYYEKLQDQFKGGTKQEQKSYIGYR